MQSGSGIVSIQSESDQIIASYLSSANNSNNNNNNNPNNNNNNNNNTPPVIGQYNLQKSKNEKILSMLEKGVAYDYGDVDNNDVMLEYDLDEKQKEINEILQNVQTTKDLAVILCKVLTLQQLAAANKLDAPLTNVIDTQPLIEIHGAMNEAHAISIAALKSTTICIEVFKFVINLLMGCSDTAWINWQSTHRNLVPPQNHKLYLEIVKQVTQLANNENKAALIDVAKNIATNQVLGVVSQVFISVRLGTLRCNKKWMKLFEQMIPESMETENVSAKMAEFHTKWRANASVDSATEVNFIVHTIFKDKFLWTNQSQVEIKKEIGLVFVQTLKITSIREMHKRIRS